MKKLSIILLAVYLSGCGSSVDPETALIDHCNSKSSNLADYAKCRCLRITGSKSYDEEMDRCMTNKEVYAKGWKGEG